MIPTWMKFASLGILVAMGMAIGWHFGGLSKQDELDKLKTAQEAQHAAQLQAVANVMTQHDQQAAAERAKLQGVIDAYDAHKNDTDPAVADIARRLRNAQATLAATAGRCSVPTGGSVAGGTEAPGEKPSDAQSVERLSELTQAHFDACAADAAELNAAVKLAP